MESDQKPVVDKHIEIEIPAYINNVIIKTENKQSTLVDYIPIKEEPLELDYQRSSCNVYDSLFEEVKHEPCDKQQPKAGNVLTSSTPAYVYDVGATLDTNNILLKREVTDQASDNDMSDTNTDSKGFTCQTTSQYKLFTSEIPNITVDKFCSNIDTNVKKIKQTKKILRIRSKKHVQEQTFVCDICQRVFNKKLFLLNHIRTHYKKVLNCKICNFQCKYNSDLVKHMYTHTGDKPFACVYCPYKCIQKIHLDLHISSHMGEKPYTCDICQYRFTRKTSLIEHMKTHTYEKCFACTLCQYRCTKKCNLQRHMRTHSGDKPFACDLCQYRSAHSANLLRHAKTHSR